MKPLFLLLTAVLLSFSAFSQSNYKPGYVLNSKGDTLRGYIDYREWTRNPESIRFKVTTSSEAQSFNVHNSAGFGVTGAEYYNRYAVTISLDKIIIDNLSVGRDTSFKTDTVFLRVVAAGQKLKLYTYRDALKVRYYIQGPDEQPQELLNSSYFNPEDRGTVVMPHSYRLQLSRYVALLNQGNQQLEDKVRYAEYNESSLKHIVDDLNGSTTVNIASKSAMHFIIGAAANLSKLKYTGNTTLASASDNKSSFFPKLDLGFDYLGNARVGQFVFRGTLSFSGANYKLTGYDNYYEANYIRQINLYTISLKPEIIYNIYNTKPFKFYINAGAGVTKSIITKNRYYITYVANPAYPAVIEFTTKEVESMWFNATAGIGTYINERYNIYAAFDLPANIVQYNEYKGKVTALEVGVHYLFGHK